MTVIRSTRRLTGIESEERDHISVPGTPSLPLVDRLGGLPVVAWMADRFVERMLDDPRLAVSFIGVDVPALKTAQEAFFVDALGGRAVFEWSSSPVMLDGDQLALAALHLNETLEGLGLSPALIEMVFIAIVARSLTAPAAMSGTVLAPSRA